MRAVAIELDVLGDTRPLWHDWLADAARRFQSISPLDPAALPEDRGSAAEELDRGRSRRRRLAGRPRSASPRTARPSTCGRTRTISAALRELAARGDRLGVFTDAPEPLARVAVAQLGADRRIEALEAGAGALERLLAKLGQDAPSSVTEPRSLYN